MSLNIKKKSGVNLPTRPPYAMRTLSCSVALLLGTVTTPFGAVHAADGGAFDNCDSKAYLTQGHLSATYALDMDSGDYQMVAPMHKNQTLPPYAWTDKASLDALGFNAKDGYVYGWSQFHKKPVRVHSDWSVEPLEVEGNPEIRFYAGDVSVPDNRYYAYSRDVGLYAIDLDPTNANYMKMRLIVSGKKLKLDVHDFAVHPTNGLIYAVESNGNVVEVDPNNGERTTLGNAKIYSNFGAAFFDDSGNLYVGRNYDGKIFRVALDSGDYTGVLHAKGPATSANDGFRCASGGSSGNTTVLADFGDAPDSYGTSLSSDGARHMVSNTNPLRMGDQVDQESDAYAFPLTDNKEGEDEDGAKFVTSVVERQTARAEVKASDYGYLNVWMDVNRDGSFEASDQLVVDQYVSPGSNIVSFPVPDNVTSGDTWARFRLSTEQGLTATGLASDGEVEDHLVNVQADRMAISTYPSTTGWSTVAFEDNWPFVGDYDMNDLVTRMRTRTYSDSTGITQVDIEGYITAAGAFYENGFGIRLPGVPRDAIDEENLEFAVSNLDVVSSPLEKDRNEAIFIITDNVFKHVTPGDSCEYYRTEMQCNADLEFKFRLSIPFLEPQQVKLSGVYDPFLFATPDSYHGAHFVTPPGRSYEVHLKNQAPTEAFDASLFAGVGQDASNAATGRYFQTESGMPWALEIGAAWRYPYEYTELSKAYPDFPAFATSGGTTNLDWHLDENAVPEHIFPE